MTEASKTSQEIENDSSGIHPNLGLLSYSSCCTLHTCPRKYQLRKLFSPETQTRERDIHTDFGSLVGLGLQHYYLSNFDLQTTYLMMLSSWKEDLDSEEGLRDKKTFFHALLAIDKFIQVAQTRFKDYELFNVTHEDTLGVNGTWAGCELGFSVSFFDNFKYRGFVDILLIHKYTRKFLVIECKTTKTKRFHPAQFKNSGQGLGYSLVVDTISSKLGNKQAEAFDVVYLVWSTSEGEWNELTIEHSHTDRAQWLRNILFDIERISVYEKAGMFPMHGESCYSYFRACDYFDLCQMSDKSLQLDKAKLISDPDEKYMFHFTLEELINAQTEKHDLVL